MIPVHKGEAIEQASLRRRMAALAGSELRMGRADRFEVNMQVAEAVGELRSGGNLTIDASALYLRLSQSAFWLSSLQTRFSPAFRASRVI
jgi:hypothetical protein